MRISKFVSFLTALAISASAFAVLPAAVSAADEDVLLAVADEETTGEGDVTPGEGEETEPTEKPSPDPITPLTVTALPKGETVSFTDVADVSYTEPTKEGDYLAVYGGEGNAITVDNSNKTINGTKYTRRIKLGGAVTHDINGAPAIRTISVTPAEAGALSIDFAHASSSGDPRTIAAYQSGAEIGTMDIAANATNTFKVNVAANEPVYIYSKVSGINIYGITLTDAVSEETEDPNVPSAEQKKMPIGASITFDAGNGTSYTANAVYGDYLAVYSNGAAVSIDGSNKTINETKYSARLKFGGKGSFSGSTPTSRVVGIIPEAAGTLVVDFANSGKDEDRVLAAVQGANTATETVAADGTATLSVAVAADVPVYLYGENGAVNLYGIYLTAGGDTPVQPTTDPSTPTNPPSGDSTPKPVDPLTELEVTSLPKGTNVNFTDVADASYTEPTVVGDYLAVYAGEERAISVDGSNKTIGDTKYSKRLKLGGAAAYDETGAPAARVISVTPAEAGALLVDFAHASSSGETRTIAAYQNGAEIGTMDAEPSATGTLSVIVAAGAPVYIYSKVSGINIYGITLIDAADLPTPPPSQQIKPLPADTPIIFDAAVGTSYTETSIYGDYTVIYVDGSTLSVDESSKTIGDTKYTSRLKFGGNSKLNSDGSPRNRVVEVKPAVSGTIVVDVAHSSSEGDDRIVTVAQGTATTTAAVAAGETASIELAVTAGVPVYIYCLEGGAINLYGIKLIAGEEPPTDTCVKVTATYNADGSLADVKAEEALKSEATAAVRTDSSLVTYWESLTSMKPVVAE